MKRAELGGIGLAARVALSAAALAPYGCALDGGAGAETQQVDVKYEPIIGGFVAESEALDAIGVVSLMNVSTTTTATTPASKFRPSCTGTLIDEDTVVTAKHCIRSFKTMDTDQQIMVFTIGPDALAPKQWVQVIEAEGAPGDEGGYVALGHDVAVLHLAKPITGIQPVKLAGTSDDQLGEEFVSIGYGTSDNNSHSGKRLVGAGILEARAGQTYELLYGSFEAFYKGRFRVAPPTNCPSTPATTPIVQLPVSVSGSIVIGPADPCSNLRAARTQYDEMLLEKADELFIRAPDEGGQPCYGDSGGPLVRKAEDGSLTTYGAVSGGTSSDVQICDYGTIYAGFPPAVLEFVQSATTWVDPCGGLATRATCEGDSLHRCTKSNEGERRALKFDCQSLGLHCVASENGSAGCAEQDSAVSEPSEADAATP